MKLFFYLIIATTIFISCGGDESQIDINARNQQEILDYLADNDVSDAFETSSGLFVRIENEGSADKPTINDEITLTYQGTFTDGTSFDGTTTPITFPLAGLILGWQEGIPHFGKGGNGSLYIPSRLAYGQSGTRGIPPNTVLVFDIDIIDFE